MFGDQHVKKQKGFLRFGDHHVTNYGNYNSFWHDDHQTIVPCDTNGYLKKWISQTQFLKSKKRYEIGSQPSDLAHSM